MYLKIIFVLFPLQDKYSHGMKGKYEIGSMKLFAMLLGQFSNHCLCARARAPPCARTGRGAAGNVVQPPSCHRAIAIECSAVARRPRRTLLRRKSDHFRSAALLPHF